MKILAFPLPDDLPSYHNFHDKLMSPTSGSFRLPMVASAINAALLEPECETTYEMHNEFLEYAFDDIIISFDQRYADKHRHFSEDCYVNARDECLNDVFLALDELTNYFRQYVPLQLTLDASAHNFQIIHMDTNDVIIKVPDNPLHPS